MGGPSAYLSPLALPGAHVSLSPWAHKSSLRPCFQTMSSLSELPAVSDCISLLDISLKSVLIVVFGDNVNICLLSWKTLVTARRCH